MSSKPRYWLQVSGIAETELDRIDGLAESIRAPAACTDPGGRSLIARHPSERVVSHAD